MFFKLEAIKSSDNLTIFQNFKKNMICKQTEKTLNNFNGEIEIDARFSYATRYFIYKNITLVFNEGELDIEKSFPNGSIEDYEINEFFPQITVPIKSLASDC